MDRLNEIYYLPDVFSPLECDEYFKQFTSLKSLKQGHIKVFGKSHLTPRLESLHGTSPFTYNYSGQQLNALPFTPALIQIKQKVEQLTGHHFNCALINYYRNGLDSNGWHADNEKELGPNPIIASVSFGAERTFKMKSNDGTEKFEWRLASGSILFMGKNVQLHYKHCIPKQPKIHKGRINITFRSMLNIES